MIGDLLRFSKSVCYDTNGIANIPSLNNIQTFFRVTYDSEGDDDFAVHMGNEIVRFKLCEYGLY